MNGNDLVFRLSEEQAQTIKRDLRWCFILFAAIIILLTLFIFLSVTTKLWIKVPLFILFPIWIALSVFGFFSLQRMLMLTKAVFQVRLSTEGLLIKTRFAEKKIAYIDIDKVELEDEHMDFEDRHSHRLAFKGFSGQNLAFVLCNFFTANELLKLFEKKESTWYEKESPPVVYPLVDRLGKNMGQLVFQPDGQAAIRRCNGKHLAFDDFDTDLEDLENVKTPFVVQCIDFTNELNSDTNTSAILTGIEIIKSPALEECRPMLIFLRDRKGRKLARIDNRLEDFSILNRKLRRIVDQVHGRTQASDPFDRKIRLKQREKMSRFYMICGMVWFGLGLLTLAGVGYEKWQYRQLQEYGVEARGTVMRLHQPTNIAYRMEYEFRSNQGQVHNRDTLLKGWMWQSLSLNDHLTVKYLSSNADFSCVPGEADGEPPDWLLILIGFSTALGACFIYVGWKGIDLYRAGTKYIGLKRGELPEDKMGL